MLAQDVEEEQWEQGHIFVIDSGFVVMWKVWKGDNFETHASVQCVRGRPSQTPYTVERSSSNDPAMLIAPEETNVLPSHVRSSVVASGGRPASTNGNHGQVTGSLPTAQTIAISDVGAVSSILKADLNGQPKRRPPRVSSSDSDTPIAAQKKRRETQRPSDDDTEALVSSRLSLDMGTSSIPKDSVQVGTPKWNGSVANLLTQAEPPLHGADHENHKSTNTPRSAGSSPIEVKQEDLPENLFAPFDLTNVMFHFLTSKGEVVRERPYSSCSSNTLLYRAADGANIINGDIDKLNLGLVWRTRRGRRAETRDEHHAG